LNDPKIYAGPSDLDIGIAIPNEKLDVNHLKLNKDARPKLYSNICMCGYPGGDQVLDPQKRRIGMR
jgi:hypothetical protein